MNTTNVKPGDLNYDHYGADKYEADIRRVIPGYEDMHKEIEKVVSGYLLSHAVYKIADLGVGTGLTAERILKLVPRARLVAVDFSKQMIGGAKGRLSSYAVDCILGDYSEVDFGNNFDIVVSVIGIHHQNTEGKKGLFRKVFDSLNAGGLFVFGDLVTYKDKEEAARGAAEHYAFLVKNAEDEKSLQEWTYHHKFLNDLAPIEDQVDWLREAGFKDVQIKFKYLNTALVVAIK